MASSSGTFVSGLPSRSLQIQLLRSCPSGHASPATFLIPAFTPAPRNRVAARSTRWSQILRIAPSTSAFTSSVKAFRTPRTKITSLTYTPQSDHSHVIICRDCRDLLLYFTNENPLAGHDSQELF